jgi:hypothetical protein
MSFRIPFLNNKEISSPLSLRNTIHGDSKMSARRRKQKASLL